MTNSAMLLQLVAEDYGVTDDQILDEYALDSVVPGICTRCHCINDSCEPDARENWCDDCEEPAVKSILVLAGYA